MLKKIFSTVFPKKKTPKGQDVMYTPAQEKKEQSPEAARNLGDNKSNETIDNLDKKLEQANLEHIVKVNNLPPNLPNEIVQLAAINDAFLQGIIALKKMNLDEDLFISAVNDLRRKYEKVREPYTGKQISSTQKKEPESPDKYLLNG